MRPFVPLLLLSGLAFLLSYCGGNTESHPISQTEAPPAWDLSELAGEWVALTATDSGWIIYESCDAGNMQMRLLKEGQIWALHYFGQQEDYTYWVDQLFEQAGSSDWHLRIHTDWDTTPLPLVFKSIADNPDVVEMHVTSSQGGLYKHRLVKSAAQHKFKRVEQDCYECWGEACDEFDR